MSKWDDLFALEKEEYDAIPIPEELEFRIRKTILADKKRRAKLQRKKWTYAVSSVAAGLAVVLLVGVNSSYSVAKNAGNLPVVGPVARVFTVRNYEAQRMAEAERISNEEAEVMQLEAVAEVSTLAEEPIVSEAEPAILEGFDKWVAEISVESLEQITSVYEPKASDVVEKQEEKEPETILLAEIPEEKIALYGYLENEKYEGVALKVGEEITTYNWKYFGETKKLPEMYYQDMTGDEEKEIVILLYANCIEKEIVSVSDKLEDVKETTAKEAIQKEEVVSKINDSEKSTVEVAQASNESVENGKTENTKAESVKEEVTKTDTAKAETTKTDNESLKEEKNVKNEVEETVSGNDPKKATVEKTLVEIPQLIIVKNTAEGRKAYMLSEADYTEQIKKLLEQYNAEKEAAVEKKENTTEEAVSTEKGVDADKSVDTKKNTDTEKNVDVKKNETSETVSKKSENTSETEGTEKKTEQTTESKEEKAVTENTEESSNKTSSVNIKRTIGKEVAFDISQGVQIQFLVCEASEKQEENEYYKMAAELCFDGDKFIIKNVNHMK